YSFKIDGTPYVYDLAELDSDPVVVENVGVTMDDSAHRLALAEHQIPLRYGAFLTLALDDIIIPAIDPYAANLDDLLSDEIDCDGIGVEMAKDIGFGSADTY